jgi:hypothetical protein
LSSFILQSREQQRQMAVPVELAQTRLDEDHSDHPRKALLADQ